MRKYYSELEEEEARPCPVQPPSPCQRGVKEGWYALCTYTLRLRISSPNEIDRRRLFTILQFPVTELFVNRRCPTNEIKLPVDLTREVLWRCTVT